eukprot:2260835-Alexandrium_andersonii.AAC.1
MFGRAGGDRCSVAVASGGNAFGVEADCRPRPLAAVDALQGHREVFASCSLRDRGPGRVGALGE